MKVKNLVQLAITLLTLLTFFFVQPLYSAQHQSLHDVYLANTEHELHVYRIYGKKPGKTIMVIGGIQGDEPGGYLTADLYADITLKQGNLIVVPRANFYSILLNQRNGLTGDMNRKFGNKDKDHKNLEQEIVSILKGLIDEADCLLNLHEGSGWYHPEWQSEIENPKRFGQSVIFDAGTYLTENGEITINQEELALRVIKRVNPQIDNPRYQFKANNHNTVSDKSSHLEQRNSASYYALTQANIPAFGIETSKSIRSNSEKVNLQKLVVNSFMTEFGIIADTPGLHMEKTEIDYVLVQVNDDLPYAVPDGSEIIVSPGDEVTITDIIANFDRGLAADFENMGSYNDTKLPFRIAQATKVLIRKDAETCGWVNIKVSTEAPVQHEETDSATASVKVFQKTVPAPKQPTLDELRAETLLINLSGQFMAIAEGEELTIARDKPLIIKGVQSNIPLLDKSIFANLKGFAPPKSNNDGNDINFAVYPEQDLWTRYSEDKKGLRYPVNAMYKNKHIGTFWIRLETK
jgi:predicted deacylase